MNDIIVKAIYVRVRYDLV